MRRDWQPGSNGVPAAPSRSLTAGRPLLCAVIMNPTTTRPHRRCPNSLFRADETLPIYFLNLDCGRFGLVLPTKLIRLIDPLGSIITLRTILHRLDILFVPRRWFLNAFPHYSSATANTAVRTTARRNHRIVFALWSRYLDIVDSPHLGLAGAAPLIAPCRLHLFLGSGVPVPIAVGQTHLLTQPLRSAFALSPSRLLLTPAPCSGPSARDS